MRFNFILKLKNFLSQNSTILSLVWIYRIFIKKNNINLVKTISKCTINKRLLIDYIDEESIILDIGSHGGSWAFFLSKLVRKGTVICFEALPTYAMALKKAVFLSRTKNIIIKNYAVNNKIESIFITWLDSNKKRLTGMTRLSIKKDKTYQKIKVQGISLDNFFLQNPLKNKKISFIKIDIEGAELLALRGGIETIIEHKPIVLMEVCIKHIQNFNYNIKDIYNFFKKIDYTPVKAIHNSMNFLERSKTDPNFNDDLIFVHKTLLGKSNA